MGHVITRVALKPDPAKVSAIQKIVHTNNLEKVDDIAWICGSL